MPIDVEQLKVIGTFLAAQRDQAPPGAIYEELAQAVHLVKRVAQRAYLAQTFKFPAASRRIDVPDELLRRLLATGMDLWVAELLAWGRSEVRTRRRKLEIAPFRSGGCTIERAYERRRWTVKWKGQLQQLGLWPS